MKQIEKPEEAFQCELLDRLEKASSIAGVRPAAFLQKVQKRGAVPVMRELLRRGRMLHFSGLEKGSRTSQSSTPSRRTQAPSEKHRVAEGPPLT